MRYILITFKTCRECLYHEEWYLGGKKGDKTKCIFRKKWIPNFPTIPSWCPLPEIIDPDMIPTTANDR